jgi:hypothetical protein
MADYMYLETHFANFTEGDDGTQLDQNTVTIVVFREC